MRPRCTRPRSPTPHVGGLSGSRRLGDRPGQTRPLCSPHGHYLASRVWAGARRPTVLRGEAKRRLRPRRVAGADRSSGRRALPRGVRRRPSRGRRWREHHAATPRMSTCRHRRATLLGTRSTTTCTRSVRVGASAAAGSRWLLHVPAAGPWRSHEEAGRRCLDGTRDPRRG